MVYVKRFFVVIFILVGTITGCTSSSDFSKTETEDGKRLSVIKINADAYKNDLQSVLLDGVEINLFRTDTFPVSAGKHNLVVNIQHGDPQSRIQTGKMQSYQNSTSFYFNIDPGIVYHILIKPVAPDNRKHIAVELKAVDR